MWIERKRLLLAALAAVAVGVFVLSFLAQPDPSVEWRSFEPRVLEVLQTNGFTTVVHSVTGSERVSLPLMVKWHPRRWNLGGGSLALIGFPNGTAQYVVTRDGTSPIEFSVGYLDGRASFIEIRSEPRLRSVARALESGLAREFPGLPIRVRIQ